MKVVLLDQKYLIPALLIIIIIILISINGQLARRYVIEASGQYNDNIPIYSVDCQDKKCAVTINCAWGADDIPDILDTLDKYNAKATFFIVGLWAEKYPDMVKLIDERGHTIANHGYSHAHMAQIPEAKVIEEIERCTEVLEKITGKRTDLFRAPYGEYNAETVKTAKKLGYYTIQWDVDSLDWKKSMSKDDIFKRVTQRVNYGSIILFHNDTTHTAEILPSILEYLTNNGYECVSVSDLIFKEDYKIRYDGRQIKK